MALREGYTALALKLQEAADSELILGYNDLRSWLNDACNDLQSECGYCWLVDIFGDCKSGDAIITVGGNLKRVPYTVSTVNGGKVTASFDMNAAEDVLPRTIYELEANDEDHYVSMEAKREKFYESAPLYERFISKSERDGANAEDFAGKGKSYPILKPEDVAAAVHAMGRAGSGNVGTSTLKSNIIRIAKRKGWGKYLPKNWQASDSETSKESLKAGAAVGDTKLVESFAFVDTVRVKESAKTDYEVKLIAPGKGSSAYYPAEVLKRDGPKVFTSGTHMYWNHATDMEEAQRPEGDLSHLAAVLTSNAQYKENGAAGPGLYARAKVFSDYAQQVEEKGPHIGLSIRASGNVEKGKMQEGRPVLKEMVYADSADFVTRAGAGGMVLTEAARPGDSSKFEEGNNGDMDTAEIKKLQESNRKLAQRLSLREARDFAVKELSTMRFPEATRERILARVVAMAPLTDEGLLDEVKFKPIIVAEAKDEAEYLTKLNGGVVVTGMGAAPLAESADPKKAQEDFDSVMGSLASALDLSESSRKLFIAGKVA